MGLSGSRNAHTAGTTSLYEQMLEKGLFRDIVAPNVPPAGRSIRVPLADSAERDLQSDKYFPLPETPLRERRYRRLSHGPGEIHVHYDLKDQKLKGADFRYGMRSVKGWGTKECMEAGRLHGVEAYQSAVKEQVYESSKREPLGKPYIRGHELKMLPEGFGVPSGKPNDSKMLIFQTEGARNSEEDRARYRKTHNHFLPGERLDRGYSMPPEMTQEGYSFGTRLLTGPDGAGMKLALNQLVEEDGTCSRTRFVQKVCEDYRNLERPRPFRKTHAKQGADGPPLPKGHTFGIKSVTSEVTAGSLIKGYYELEAQLPDQDLGRCVKPGRRNVTKDTRAFGIPSIRTDIPAPAQSKRSVSDWVSYGDEPGVAAILAPQRFDYLGVPDRDFLVRRSREELEALTKGLPVDQFDFPSLWEEALGMFDDGKPLVSLDALLHVQTQRMNVKVAHECQGLHLLRAP